MDLTVSGLTNTSFSDQAADRLDHSKKIHEKTSTIFINGTVVADSIDMMIANVNGVLRKFMACITTTIATGADRTITVDLQLGNTGNTFATVLGPAAADADKINFTNTSVLRTFVANDAVFAITSFSENDILRCVITVAGAAGAQAVDMVVTLIYSENPTTV